MDVDGGWQRVRRLDGQRLVDEVNDRAGLGLRFAGYCEGGQVGACFATYPAGREVVLTWWPSEGAARMPIVRRVLSRLWDVGYPAPRYETVVQCADGVAVVQSRVTGDRVRVVTLPLVEELVELNEARQSLFDHPAGSLDDLYLTEGGPGFCLHGPLRAYSPETRRLLDWIEAVGAALPSTVGSGTDAVHGDFHPGNVLLQPGSTDQVAGIVDWTGAYLGDADKDLVDLAFACEFMPSSAGARDYVRDHVVSSLDTDRLVAFCAHQSLRIVDWSIRHFTDVHTARWLDISRTWQAVATS